MTTFSDPPVRNLMLICGMAMLSSCTLSDGARSGAPIDFYHWKSTADWSEGVASALALAKTTSIYMHYFDVSPADDVYGGVEIYPHYVIQDIAREYGDMDIIPVVFLTNNVFSDRRKKVGGAPDHQKEDFSSRLAMQVGDLIEEIHQEYFGRPPTMIQIDCDWTATTGPAYFAFLEAMQDRYTVSVTIRLHQVKYPDKAGVPPVSRGTLMVYNVGDIDDMDNNSILRASVVGQYITNSTTYPLKLDVALPLYGQTVLRNPLGEIRLIDGTDDSLLRSDSRHFERISDDSYLVKADTFYKGFYLDRGYALKSERSESIEVLGSMEILRESKLDLGVTILYDLDEQMTARPDLIELIRSL